MLKNYIEWMILKRIVEYVDIRPPFRQRDIWYTYLGENIGDEEDGVGADFLRPAIILRKFSSHLCWIVPLTNTAKDGTYCHSFSFQQDIVSTALLTHIRVIDAKRLLKK